MLEPQNTEILKACGYNSEYYRPSSLGALDPRIVEHGLLVKLE